ncbi:MAG: TIGR02281 family clan AA aspartic protease [Rickettsiales bacterium]|jgi:aspartyl protease family protein|nr:TIGR02281 family clan AA aspartic protease [Rickettsiales bacterium]
MFNLSGNDWGKALSLVIIIGFMFSSLFIRNALNKNEKIKNILIWLVIIFFIAIAYNNKHLLEGFVPYKASGQRGEIEIRKADDGHFYLMTNIQGNNILFLIDTGATITSLNTNDAKKLGIEVDKIVYNIPSITANGTVFGASAEVNNIIVNDYRIEKLKVHINKNMKGESLLGMNFLSQLEGYEIKKDRMILRYK